MGSVSCTLQFELQFAKYTKAESNVFVEMPTAGIPPVPHAYGKMLVLYIALRQCINQY